MSGDIAESIAIILTRNVKIMQIYGSDVDSEKINTNLCEKIFKSPLAENPKYYSWLVGILSEYKFEFFIPCSEDELFSLASLSDDQLANINRLTKIVWAGKTVVKSFESKSKTNTFLKTIHLNPPEIFSDDSALTKFPVIVKPDVGRGSKNVFVCHDKIQLESALILVKNPIIQEYIPGLESEYTCSVYRTLEFGTACIILRRYLSGGVTNWAEVINDKAIKDICIRIADQINLEGSINIQLRKSNQRIAIFEINPRFSSTVFIRSLVEFNDVLWSLGFGNPAKDYLEENHYGVRFKIVKTAEIIK